MYQVYSTDRLILKTLTPEAAPMVLDFYEYNRTLFEVWEPKRAENFYTLSYQKASLSAEYHQMTDGKLLRYWVFLKEVPEEIIGTVCFQNYQKAPYHCCSLGYKFSRSHHHCGYAYESIQKAIDLIFNNYHIHRLEAFIMPNNGPSLRLIERLSFLYEGMSGSYALINGSWEDHKRYALINPKDRIDSLTASQL
jgi:ribosomal-protein-alanine N-acetyltransferase